MTESDRIEDPREALDAALGELEARIGKHEEKISESLLDKYPNLKKVESLAIELIYAEYVGKKQRGIGCDLSELGERFPQWSESLKRLIAIDDAMWSGDSTKLDGSKQTFAVKVARARFGPLPEIPNYEIIDSLGQGAMGVVFKARQTNLDRIVALKVIRSGIASNDEGLARFRIEGKAVASLDHPNVVHVFDVGEVDGRPYLTQELVTGGTLKQYISDQSVSIDQAVEMAEKIARAIHFAHQRGIVHRDLKPSNVLMTTDGDPKVADFGLAKRLDDESDMTRSGVIIGTPGYMAPEQADRKFGDIGVATDVYGLGAILYELLTGRAPFSGDSLMETISQVCFDDPQSIRLLTPRAPRDLVSICNACLQKKPADRYESALALAEDLQRFRTHRPIKVQKAAWPALAAKWARRNPALSAVAVTIIVVASVSLLLGLFSWMNHVRSQTAIASEIDAELNQAQRLQELVDPTSRESMEGWAQALARVQRAETLSRSLANNDPRHDRIRELAAVLDHEAKIRELYVTLEELRLRFDSIDPEEFDWGQVHNDFQSAFESMQINPMTASSAQIKTRIPQPTPYWLIRALDDWSFVAQQLEAYAATQTDWQRVSECASDLDDSSLRGEIRHAWRTENAEDVLAMVSNLDLDQLDLPTRQMLADRLVGLGYLGAAVELIESHYWQASGDFWLNLDLAVLCLQTDPPRLNDAIRYGQCAVAISPNKAEPYAVVGSAYLRMGDLNEAERLFERSLAIVPGRESVTNRLALVYLRRYDLEKARDLLEPLATNPSVSSSVLFNLGHVYRSMREFEQATSVYERLIEIDPEDPDYYLQLALSLINSGQFEDAITRLNGSLEIERLPPESRLQTLGLLQRASALNDVAKNMPNSIYELEGSISVDYVLGFGQVSFHQGRFRESFEFYELGLAERETLEDIPVYEAAQNLNAAIVAALLVRESIAEESSQEGESTDYYLDKCLEFLERGTEMLEAVLADPEHAESAEQIAQSLAGFRTDIAFRELQSQADLRKAGVDDPQKWMDAWDHFDEVVPYSDSLNLRLR